MTIILITIFTYFYIRSVLRNKFSDATGSMKCFGNEKKAIQRISQTIEGSSAL